MCSLFHMSTTLTANISLITLNLPSLQLSHLLICFWTLFMYISSNLVLITHTVYNFIHNRTPMAYLTRVKTELGSKPAPFVATFSSRGPNLLEQGILKVNYNFLCSLVKLMGFLSLVLPLQFIYYMNFSLHIFSLISLHQG